MNWEKQAFMFDIPDSEEKIEVPILNPQYPLRVARPTVLPAETATLVEAKLPQVEAKGWLVGRTFTTAGALNLPTSVEVCTEQNTLKVWLCNWTRDEIMMKENALLGMITPDVEIIDPKEVKVDVEGNVVFSSESFAEHKADLENVSYVKIGTHWDQETQKELKRFLKKWADVFAKNPKAPKPYKGPPFKIDTGDASPIKDGPRRNSPPKEVLIAKLIKEMKEHFIVEDSNSPWGTPVVLAKKKDGSWRFCVDFRALNAVTRKTSYPLPRIDDTLDALGFNGGSIYSTLDICSGYWHIPLDQASAEKTAFVTRDGQYQFRVLPFGLTGAPGAFCSVTRDSPGR